MSAAELRPLDEACPFLGLPDDDRSHFAFPDQAHRCYARRKVVPLDLPFQGSYCLTAGYESCERFQTAQRPLPRGSGTPTQAPIAGQPRVADQRPRARRRGRRFSTIPKLLAMVVAAGLLGLLAVTVIAGFPLDRLGFTPGAVPTSAALSAEPADTLAPRPSPTGAPSVTSGGEPSASPSSSPGPTATPTASTSMSPSPSPLIHTVESGETLTSIGALYGVQPQAIRRANDLQRPRLIVPGQELIIPIVAPPTTEPSDFPER